MKKNASLNTMFGTGMNLVENFKKQKSSNKDMEGQTSPMKKKASLSKKSIS